jgi:BlaI family transcriptional regulator, penicillinase repressor
MYGGSISKTELAVLKLLWERSSGGTVRELQAILREQEADKNWAYTTVQTLLTRLEEKGFVESDKTGLAHIYRAKVSREELLHRRLSDLADQLCEGTASPLVLALVEGGRFSSEEIDQLRKLLDQVENDSPRKKGRSSP